MLIKSLNKLLGLLGIQIKRNKALLTERYFLDSKYNGAVAIFKIHRKYCSGLLNDDIEGMVFSKDRAIQLHALLHSYLRSVQNYCSLTILYKVSNEKSKKAYEDLKKEFSVYEVTFIEETEFKLQVTAWLTLSKADRIFFMTDDAVFLEAFDMNTALLFNPLNTVFSLTKGYDLTYCFTLDMKQDVPEFKKIISHNGYKFNFWDWGSNNDAPDWSYPLSVDGNFFLREEMLAMIKNISFKNPNSLEASLQVFIDFFSGREGVCFDKARLVNIPCNLVQQEFKNRSTGLFTAEELQDIWDEGKRIDIEKFKHAKASEAVHMRYSFVHADF